jgi:hypothetical protein
MLSLDDRELGALMQAAAGLPTERRGHFLVDVASAVAVTGTADIVQMIDRLVRTHHAAAAMSFCSAGDDCERFQGI